MPTTNPHARTRVSAYQARIERSLTDIFMTVPEHHQAGQEWVLTHVAHTQGFAQCELCGHVPIKRLFFIRSTSTGEERMIGSECARNYARVDLVDAWMRNLQSEQNRRRNATQRAERQAANIAARQERRRQMEEQRATRAQVWTAAHSNLVAYLNVPANVQGNSFMTDMVDNLRTYGSLTERQTEVAERIMRERQERASQPRQQNALDLAARPDDLTHIYNGVYTMTNTATREHMTFQIYTPLRGPLQGVRIVKRMTAYSQYEGFAFVGRDASLVVWRRYLSHRDQPYMVWARDLLDLLNERGQDNPGVDSLMNHTYVIERSRACRRCNRRLTTPTSIHAGIGPECMHRVSEETTAARQTTTITADLTGFNEAIRRVDAAARPVIRSLRPERRSSAPRVVATEQLAMSELGTGEVL